MPTNKRNHFVFLHTLIFGCLFNLGLPSKYSDNGVGGPYQYINHLTPYFPELAPYMKLQQKLENIADEERLYDQPPILRSISLIRLKTDPKVRSIISQCKEFYNQPSCKPSIYRSENGRCNNLANPDWGSSSTAQERLLPAFYEGASEFRRSVSGKPLPRARDIKITTYNNNTNPRISSIFVVFGQAIAHDMVQTPRLYEDDSEDICTKPSFLRYQIFYDANDPFYSKFNVTCGDFFRNAVFPKCNFEKRDIINMATSIIDASDFYGSNAKRAKDVRAMDDSGKLRMQNGEKVSQLMGKAQSDTYCLKDKPELCFTSGDGRINQHTLMAVFGTKFTRLHNLLADKFHAINPHWDGNKIFQEARRMIAAIYQFITYNDYLPLLVGPKIMEKYDLGVHSPTKYDPWVKSSQLIEFSTAAYRLHPMIPHVISLYNSTTMASTFSYNQPLFDGYMDQLLAGLTVAPCDKYAANIIGDMRNNMLKPHPASYGLDIASTNIQRGRDHGLPPYVNMVKKCDKKVNIRNFDDLLKLMPEENVKNLKESYEDVADIDLWIGMISETHLPDGELGPTASCVIGEQFRRVKFGDAFFFTHSNGRYPYTEDQLKIIRSFSLSKVACITSHLPEVRKQPLQSPTPDNGLIPCENYADLDLSAWKEDP